MLWGCFVMSGTGGTEYVKRMMKSEEYQGILEQNGFLVTDKQI